MKVAVFFCLLVFGFSFLYAQDAELSSLSIGELTARMEKEPRNDALYNERAMKYAEARRFPEALDDTMLAISIKPGNFENWATQGRIFFMAGRVDLSISAFLHVLDLSPGTKHGYEGLYVCYFAKREFDKALVCANKLVEIEPENDESYKSRAIIHMTAKDVSKAMTDLNRAIELNPSDKETFGMRAFLYAHEEKYEKALSDFDAAIRLDAGYADAWSGRAYVHYHLKNYQQTIDDTTMYMSLVPEIEWADIRGRGMAYEALAGQTEDEAQKAEYLKKAEADYAWARELGWDGIE
jgi:tetratricopeptide (TPR) repeat protein